MLCLYIILYLYFSVLYHFSLALRLSPPSLLQRAVSSKFVGGNGQAYKTIVKIAQNHDKKNYRVTS